MNTRDICLILQKYGNCYVNDMPSQNRIQRIKQQTGLNIRVRNCVFLESGYVIEAVKEVKQNVGNEPR